MKGYALALSLASGLTLAGTPVPAQAGCFCFGCFICLTVPCCRPTPVPVIDEDKAEVLATHWIWWRTYGELVRKWAEELGETQEGLGAGEARQGGMEVGERPLRPAPMPSREAFASTHTGTDDVNRPVYQETVLAGADDMDRLAAELAAMQEALATVIESGYGTRDLRGWLHRRSETRLVGTRLKSLIREARATRVALERVRTVRRYEANPG